MGIQSEPRILSIIADSIREEFRKNPFRTANKLTTFKKVNGNEESFIAHGMITRANWGLLDPYGLGLYAGGHNTYTWFDLIEFIGSGRYSEIARDLSQNANIFKVLDNYGKWGHKVDNTRLRFSGKGTSLSKITKDQIEALSDWLIDPGF